MKKEEFIEYLNTFTNGEKCYLSLIDQKKFFRVNTNKISIKDFKKLTKIKCSQNPFIDEAYECRDNSKLGNTWEYFLGYLHPQSLSSMIPPIVLNPKPREHVLDLTSAPGGKTTQMSAMMKNTGVIIANDKPEKEGSLFSNITRLGCLNTMVTIKDAKNFKLRERFDKVLLDAPCSALGGEKAAHLRYKPEMSSKLSKVQKVMILNAFDSLKDGGELVYSTCTFAREENEEVIEFLLYKREEAHLENIRLDIPHQKGLGLDKVWRVCPQDLESEGFFISKIKKVL